MLNKKLSALIFPLATLVIFLIHVQIQNWLISSNGFAIKEVQVFGATISRDLAFETIVQRYTNDYTLYNLDMFGLQKELERLDLIQMATINKNFPFTLTIEIMERVPISRIKSANKTYMVDKEGHIVNHEDKNILLVDVGFGFGVHGGVIDDALIKATLSQLGKINIDDISKIVLDRKRETYFELKDLSTKFFLKTNVINSEFVTKAEKVKAKIKSSTSVRVPKEVDLHSYDDRLIGTY